MGMFPCRSATSIPEVEAIHPRCILIVAHLSQKVNTNIHILSAVFGNY